MPFWRKKKDPTPGERVIASGLMTPEELDDWQQIGLAMAGYPPGPGLVVVTKAERERHWELDARWRAALQELGMVDRNGNWKEVE